MSHPRPRFGSSGRHVPALSPSSCLLVLAILFTSISAWSAQPAITTGEVGDNLLRFTSAGHALGFGHDSFYVVGADRFLRVEHVGGRPVRPVAEGLETSPDGMPALGMVTYFGAWDGVDVVYKAAPNGIFESRYHIRNTEQGLLVDSIRLRYNRPVALDGKGNLVTAFDNGNMVESAPIAWQEVGGEKHFIDAAFVLHGKDEVGFALGDCLPGIPVIIDPVLTWNTFLGGAGGDRGFDITTDDSGNVYVTGNSAASWGSPRRGHQGGSTDAFAAKIDGGTGALIWNTFLGGTATDAGAGIAVDGSGNVYVVGFSTASWQGASPPVRAFAGNSDAFVARLDSSGNLVWNTFLGGGTNDFGYAIVLDGSGNIYVTGESHATWGSPRRSYMAFADAFVAKLVAATGALEGNTFLGGSGEDFGYGIALDGSGNIYVTGESDATWGDPHRVFSGSTDAFVAMLSGEAGDGLLDLQGNGFLGGSGEDSGNGIALDEGGSIFVVGTSSDSWGTPSRPHAGNYDAFVLRLNGETAALEALAFLGGSGDDYGRGIALDDTGNVYVTGESSATWGSPIREFSGDTDAFTAKFNSASGAVVWNAFLGGTGTDSGSGLTTSGVGTVYVTGYGDSSWGNPVRGYTADGFYDCFVAKVVKQGGLAGVLMLLLGE